MLHDVTLGPVWKAMDETVKVLTHDLNQTVAFACILISPDNLTKLLKNAIYSELSHRNIMIFHSYVSVPEGILIY